MPVSGAPAAVTAPEGTLNKIEPLVLKEITAEGETELFVWMVEKADLSLAYELGTKQEKGRFVLNALAETAERTQQDLRAYLDAQRVEYQAFNVVLTGHPWVQGVPHPFSGDYASHDSLTNLVPGTLEICEAQGSGKATLLEYDLGVGHLAVTGQTLELAWANGWDGAPIPDQSLLYMYAYVTGGDVSWIWEDPASDTVPARPFTAEMQNVDIYFTAVVTDPLPLGTYTATLKVLNNDPVAGIQDVLALMHIVEEHLAPTASFESNSPVREGTEVVFTNTTTVGIPPETDYLWDFGDGETSAEFEPTHIYAEPGTYDVTLEACNLAGMCDTYADTVEVIGYYYLPLTQKNYE